MLGSRKPALYTTALVAASKMVKKVKASLALPFGVNALNTAEIAFAGL